MERGSRVVLAVAALALYAVGSTGCALRGARESTSSAGYAGAPPMAPAGGIAADGSNAQFDAGYRAAGVEFKSAEHAPGSQPTAADAAVLPQGAAGSTGSVADRIEAWFSPAAYAADTALDAKYLIRTGQVSTTVKDIDAEQASVEAIALKYGGVVTDSRVSNYGDGQRNGTILLRVPNTRFMDAFNELRAIGDVESHEVTSQDVSHEYVNAVSRLKNLNAEQETLRGMLAEALEVQRQRGLGEAYSVLLETQKRLSEVTGEIQAAEDRLGQLADQISFSTITVNLFQRSQVEPGEFSWGFAATLDAAKRDVVMGLRNFANGLLYFVVAGWMWLWPWALAGYIAWRLWKRYGRPLRRRLEPAPPSG